MEVLLGAIGVRCLPAMGKRPQKSRAKGSTTVRDLKVHKLSFQQWRRLLLASSTDGTITFTC
jgi:hypothetical protein